MNLRRHCRAVLLLGIQAAWTAPAMAAGMLWSTFLGGGGEDIASAVVADASGAVFVVGRTTSTNYPTTAGATQQTLSGGSDITVTKLSSDGRSVVWSTLLGGSGYDEAKAVAVDGAGNLFLCGHTASLDFPTTPGAFRTQHAGGVYDGFVAEFAPDGTLRFATYLGGNGDDYARCIAMDGSGRPVVAGQTGSTDWPTTAGVVRPTRSPSLFDGADGFVTKLASTGGSLVFSTYVGSNANADGINGLALDGLGKVLVTGVTASSSGFPLTPGAFDSQLSGSQDGFVTCLNSGATAYVFSTYLGGIAYDAGVGAGFGPDGSVYVAGRTSSTDFPVTGGALQRTFGGGNFYDVFVSRLNATGTTLLASTYLGGATSDTPWGLCVSVAGQACVTGYTDSNSFPTTPGAYDQTFNGGLDAFVAVVSADASRLDYSTYLGGSGNEHGLGVTHKPGGSLLVSGFTSDGSFPTTSGAYDRTHNSPGVQDGFAVSLDVGLDGSVGVVPMPPARAQLSPPAPNPFAGATQVRLRVDVPGPATVRVLDVAGRAVRLLFDGRLEPGPHAWTWDGRSDEGADPGAGVYLIEVRSGAGHEVRKAIRLK